MLKYAIPREISQLPAIVFVQLRKLRMPPWGHLLLPIILATIRTSSIDSKSYQCHALLQSLN